MFIDKTARSARLHHSAMAGAVLLGLLVAGPAAAETFVRIDLGGARYASHDAHRHHATCGHGKSRHAVRYAFPLLLPHFAFGFDRHAHRHDGDRKDRAHRYERKHEKKHARSHRKHEDRHAKKRNHRDKNRSKDRGRQNAERDHNDRRRH